MQAEVRVEIAPGPLGLVFEPGSTVVHTVKPGSALSDCEPGDYIAAFRKPGAGDDSERLDCRSMTDVAFTELVTSFKDQPGRVVWLVRTNVYTVGCGPGRLSVVFAEGTATIIEVKESSALLGKVNIGDTLVWVNGKSVSAEDKVEVLKAEDDGAKERMLVFRKAARCSAGGFAAADGKPKMPRTGFGTEAGAAAAPLGSAPLQLSLAPAHFTSVNTSVKGGSAAAPQAPLDERASGSPRLHSLSASAISPAAGSAVAAVQQLKSPDNPLVLGGAVLEDCLDDGGHSGVSSAALVPGLALAPAAPSGSAPAAPNSAREVRLRNLIAGDDVEDDEVDPEFAVC